MSNGARRGAKPRACARYQDALLRSERGAHGCARERDSDLRRARKGLGMASGGRTDSRGPAVEDLCSGRGGLGDQGAVRTKGAREGKQSPLVETLVGKIEFASIEQGFRGLGRAHADSHGQHNLQAHGALQDCSRKFGRILGGQSCKLGKSSSEWQLTLVTAESASPAPGSLFRSTYDTMRTTPVHGAARQGRGHHLIWVAGK